MTGIPRMGEEDIKKLALGLAQNKVFAACYAPLDMWPSIFIPLALGLPDSSIEDLGMVVEEMAKAGTISVNGYPTFLSCQLVHKDDWPLVVEKAEKIEKAIKEAADA